MRSRAWRTRCALAVAPSHSDDLAAQVLAMETERFSVPELLFHPSDIGIDQAGIAEAAWQGLQAMSLAEMGLAAANVVLTGGSTRFPQFGQRFAQEFRQYVPDIFPVEV